MATILGNSVNAVMHHVPTRNNASHDNQEKINSWVSSSFLYEYGALPELCYNSKIPLEVATQEIQENQLIILLLQGYIY